MNSVDKHLIESTTSIKDVLIRLNELSADAIVFIVDTDKKLLGSLTDGDVRRALIKNEDVIHLEVKNIIQANPKFIEKGKTPLSKIIEYREKNFKVLPIVDAENRIIGVVNFRTQKSYLPIEAVIMAGGQGKRLRPLTEAVPKPLLHVGDKPIIEHNIDRLSSFGIKNIHISINYLGEMLQDYFKDGSHKGLEIKYLTETKPLGTIGAASALKNTPNDYVLLTNSDILTTLNYEQFYLDCLNNDADIAVVTIPYKVDIPYGVLETQGNKVIGLQEKPTYTYYSNGGIYLIKREVLEMIPEGEFCDTTDIIERLISKGKNVLSYPMSKYWLDIGSHSDYKKAQEDIHKI